MMRSLPFVPDVAAEPAWEPAWVGLAALVDASLKGLVLLLCAAILTLVLRRASAAARHLVWSLAFAGLLVLPLLSPVLPTWRVPLLPSAPPAAESVSRALADATVIPARIDAVQPRREPASAARSRMDSPWARGVLLVWLVGALLVLGSLLLGTGRLWWLARRAHPVTTGPQAALAERIRAELGLRRPVRLIESAESAMPMAWGIMHPTVLIPMAARDWPIARQRAMLLHELSHVQRHDCLSQLAVELACALYWFNPLVWVAARRVRIEREHACDDQVLRTGAKASEYASQLLEVARSLRAARGIAFAAVPMARRSQLRGRLLAVLDEHRDRGAASRRLAIPASLVAIALVLPLAALSPVDRAPDSDLPIVVVPARALAPEVMEGGEIAVGQPGPFELSAGGITSSEAGASEAERPAINDTIPIETAGILGVVEEQQVQAVARKLSKSDKRLTDKTALRLRRLFSLPGVNFYLHFDRTTTPFDLVLAPTDSSEIVMPFESGASLSAGPSPIPVFVFWVRDGGQRAYSVSIPPYVTHVTIVANGREIVATYPIEHTGKPVTFRVE